MKRERERRRQTPLFFSFLFPQFLWFFFCFCCCFSVPLCLLPVWPIKKQIKLPQGGWGRFIFISIFCFYFFFVFIERNRSDRLHEKCMKNGITVVLKIDSPSPVGVLLLWLLRLLRLLWLGGSEWFDWSATAANDWPRWLMERRRHRSRDAHWPPPPPIAFPFSLLFFFLLLFFGFFFLFFCLFFFEPGDFPRRESSGKSPKKLPKIRGQTR